MKKNILLKCTGASDPFATAGKKATVIGWVNICAGENFSIVPRDKSGKIIPMEIEVPARDIPELIKSLSDLYSNYQQDKPWLPTLEAMECKKSGDTPRQQEPAQRNDGSNSLDIRVGGKYLTRGGQIAVVSHILDNGLFPIIGDINGYGRRWDEMGRYFGMSTESPHDLMKKITEE